MANPMQAEFSDGLLEDLDQLIRLHDRELDAETLNALKVADFPAGLALGPDNEIAALAVLHENPLQQTIDELAADCAAIYLNNSLGASPLLDEMFNCPLPTREEMAARIHRKLALDRAEIAPIRFMPGAQGPS
jgi:hypothetical protein